MCDLANFQAVLPRAEFATLVFIVRMTTCKGLKGDQIPLSYFTAPGATGYCRRTVVDAIAGLKKRGLVEVVASRFGRAASMFRPLIGQEKPAAVDGAPTAPDRSPSAPEVQPLHPNKDIVHTISVLENRTYSSQSVGTADETPGDAETGMPKPEPKNPEPEAERWTAAEVEAVRVNIAAYGGKFKTPPVDVIRRVLAAGEAWSRNGFECGAALYRAQRRVKMKREYMPREWSWFPSVVRNEFQNEVNEDRTYSRQARQSAAVATEAVVSIAEPPLPLREAKPVLEDRWYDSAEELVAAGPRRPGESDEAYWERVGICLRRTSDIYECRKRFFEAAHKAAAVKVS